MQSLEDQKEALKYVIKFYISRYPNNITMQKHFEEISNEIDKCKTNKKLESFWQLSDTWIDY